MRLFACPVCGATLFFRNLVCGCGAAVAFDPEAAAFVAADAPCANRAEIGCNWVADPAASGGLCRACAMTEVIPQTFHGENRVHWAEAEAAKRWVVATLGRWGWFRADDPGPPPVFHMLAEATSGGGADVTMGHADGLLTINVTEADTTRRDDLRVELGERLRTLTGHFRHELAHYFFHRLAMREGFLPLFREVFGDERSDYAAALAAHYADGPPPDWPDRCISAYASAHPHEDWAESVAHLLHLTDIADSFLAAGLRAPSLPDPGWDPYAETDAERLVLAGADLGIALNHVNRSMGLPDLYPFVLVPAVRAKLAFAHRWIAARD